MSTYDFQSLSPEDFELLVRDLLQEELGVRLESFAKGTDGGIDFRFRDDGGTLVVQCKHYAEFADLHRALSCVESPKVRRLRPGRYILAVSTKLTPHRKDQILALLAPYCQGPSDILGREDINNLLGLFPSVERRHFKLWLTSNAVLTRLLSGGIWEDAQLTVERIRRRMRLYVPNPSLGRARKILEQHGYCIIAGIPGIGKTTLAEILLVDYVDRHGFQAVRIANDLLEIKPARDPERRQIFYFDDFLGKTTLDKLQKNEDQRLLEFMEEVGRNRNWRFILTTREYILNAATMRYEALAHPPISLSPCIIQLADYTYPIRAKILYNHVFFSDLPHTHKRALLEGRRYVKILEHRNYNPRIVEHMTRSISTTSVPASRYFETFMDNLENPARIWDHAFRYQLSQAAHDVLLVMGSLPEEVRLAGLEAAFNRLYQHRREKFGFATSSEDFENAIKELDGNFIKTELIGTDRVVAFHNPSVADFLEAYLAGCPGDVEDLLEAACFFEQFTRLWSGQRGTRFSGVDLNARKFVRALVLGWLAPKCGVWRAVNEEGKVTRVRCIESSPEVRARFALEVTCSLRNADSQELLDHVLRALLARTEEGSADKEGLVNVLKALAAHRVRSEPARSLFAAAAAYLKKDPEDLEDFTSLGSFVEGFPDAIDEAELAKIGSEFLHFCEDCDGSWADEPDDLRALADDLRRVGLQLDATVSSFCEALERRAAEWDDELPNAGQDEDCYPEEEWLGENRSWEDVDTMFDRLLREIDEETT